jgi:ribosome-binding protein aMBF1 (putative translation factor)
VPRTSSTSTEADVDEPVSTALGRTVDEHVAAGQADAEERAEFERLAAFEQLARLVIMRRQRLGITQAELARRMNAPQSVVSRIESGQHQTNTATLKRVAEALDGRAVMGFAFGPGEADPPIIVRL